MPDEELIWGQVERTFRAGRLAHAWMLIGDPRGNADRMARRMAGLVLCEGHGDDQHPRILNLAAEGRHPDLARTEPQSKSRRIGVDEIRELNIQLNQSAYEEGWKVAILYHADRLTEQAANAFLKTLEEPPGRTLLLLLTDAPQNMLNTITSRCQRLILSSALADQCDPVWQSRLESLLAAGWPRDMVETQALAGGIEALLSEETKRLESLEKQEAEEEVEKKELEARLSSRAIHIRTDMLEAMLIWYRDVMMQACGVDDDLLHLPKRREDTRASAETLGADGARECLDRLWELQRMLDRNIPMSTALCCALRPTPASSTPIAAR